MPEIRPFRALRYDPAAVGDLAAVVAPPYDVIDDAHRDALYARNPYNVVRLELGRETDRYASAAGHFTDWRRRGVLRRDAEPALYLYEQTFALAGGMRRTRAGIIGAVRLESFGSGGILPHERTLAAPKADRMRLIEACEANLSAIFGLYPQTAPVVAEARGTASRQIADFEDEFGDRHRVWLIADPDFARCFGESLASQRIYIADGHHRYETAVAFRDRVASRRLLEDDDPVNFVMMYVCCMHDPGLVVLPTHRVLAGLADFEARIVLDRLRGSFDLREFAATPDGRAALLAALRAAGGTPCFAVALRGVPAHYLASLRDSKRMDLEAGDLAPPVRRLDVSVLDRLVLRGTLGLEAAAAAASGCLRYVKGDDEAMDAVARGDADVAVLLNAARIEDIVAVCESGETMPEKSTYFFPKLLTGIVFRTLREEP